MSIYSLIREVILSRICRSGEDSDILTQKEDKDHAQGQNAYTLEFKREEIRLAQTSRKLIAQLARELVISDTSIPE